MSDRTAVLKRLSETLVRFGIANDADDHNCGDEGNEIRASASDEIRKLIQQHSFITEVLPRLEWELETRHIEGFGWSNLVDALEREIGTDTTPT